MQDSDSVRFFEAQFQRQLRDRDFRLNPFELAALPHLRGRVLDYGCGLGNLAFAAAERGCTVTALDASPAAIAHIRKRAADESLPVKASLADLRNHEPAGDFDAVVSIGLLMFFDCPTAFRVLNMLLAHVRPDGIAVVNVLTDGTTYLDMFGRSSHCLFSRTELESRLAGWKLISSELSDFEAPGGRIKSFATVIAQKPHSLASP